MHTLSRYILRQQLAPFLFGFGLILFVLLLDFVLQHLDQVLSKGIEAGLAGRLLLYNTAWITALAVPMAVLIAVLMSFGRLATDHEIMAARACGFGFARLLRPVLVAAGALSVLMVWFNDRVLPDANYRARTIAADLQRRKAALVLKEKEGLFIEGLGQYGAYSLLVRRVDERGNELYGITLYDSGHPGPPSTLYASRGRIHIYDEGRYVRLTLFDGEFHRIEAGAPERFARGRFARQVIHIADPQRAFNRYQSTYRSDREMDIAAMYRAVQEYRLEERRTRSFIDSTRRAFAAGPDSTAAASRRRELRLQFEQRGRLQDNRARRIDVYLVEIHKKFSIPAACLVFALMGAPLGGLIRRRGAAVSVGVSLVFFWIYWMFLIGGEELADRGYLAPGLAMWAPNLVFGLLGLWLLRAAERDRPLFGGWRRRAPQEGSCP